MEEEMAALNRNHTWTLTTLPRGRSPVDCRWIYKLKHRVGGSIERYKARLVAKGIVSIWVDDGLVASSSKKIVLEIIEYLQLQFEIVSRPADLFVGLLINRNRDKKYLHLSQPTYISKILSKFCMQDCHSKATPADPFNRLTKESSTADSDSSKLFPFQEAVGSLLYCMITTRPDISYAVGQVAQFTTNLGKSHCEAVKRILSYLKGTATFGLRFQKTQSNGILFAFTDADYAGDLDSRRSTTGYVLTLNAGPVAWGSIKQKSVALSTTEAEYIAACHTAKEIVWLRNLLHEIGFEQVDSTTLFCDNQSAVRLVFNPEFHKRTKHIDVQHHFIREKQNDGSLHMQYLPTEEQLADLFTKPLPGPRFEKLRRQIGIEDLLV
jgi:hypothetical protein